MGSLELLESAFTGGKTPSRQIAGIGSARGVPAWLRS